MPPVVRVQHTQRKYLYRALQRTQGSGGRSETVPQQAGPSADARIGGEGEWGKGSRGAGRARGRCTSQRDASGCERRWRYAPHLRPISSTFSKYPKSWSGSRRRESGPEAEGRHSIGDCGRNRFFCKYLLQVCNAYITGNPSPAVQAPSRAQFMHTGHRTLHAGAKGGWGHGCAAGGAAHRGFRTSGGRPGSFGRCPLAELCRDPVRRHLRPSRPLLRA